MRKILVSDAQPNMILAKNIYSNEGKILLAKGIKLKQSYLDKLLLLDIPAIYIKDDTLQLPATPELVSEQTRHVAIENVKDVFHQITFSQGVNLKETTQLVNNIIDELLANKNVLYNLTEIRSYDNYTFAHCVNVAVLSILTGITLNFNQLELRDLGLGAMLHDIGKITIDPILLNKKGALNSTEFEVIKEHSSSGFNLLRKIDGLSTLSAHIAFQHHEKFDGSGYPRGLKGDQIHIYSRIVAVADVYDALIADRIYRQGYTSQEAVQIITSGSNVHFDAQVLKAFLKNIFIFPIGSLVQLNTGDIAVVVDINKDLQTKPVIRLLNSHVHGRYAKSREIDLCKQSNIYITKTLKPSDPEYLATLNINIENAGEGVS